MYYFVEKNQMQADEKHRFDTAVTFTTLFVALLWLIKISELAFGVRLSHFGILPLKASGLAGIITAPMIHGSVAHLSANTIPVWVLSVMLFYFYRPIAWKVFVLVWLITGIWVWFLGRESYHIGVSGIIYGLASFLFFSGLIRRDNRLLAITFLVAFLYGSLVWGLFPELFPEKHISWESHLMGLLSGFVLAIFYKNEGPKRRKYSWDFEDEDEEEEEENAYWKIPPPGQKPKSDVNTVPDKKRPLQINYIYTEKKKNKETPDK
jgi:membrane associated rhomboid family serine protease